jgi:hypothetical protein
MSHPGVASSLFLASAQLPSFECAYPWAALPPRESETSNAGFTET